MKYIIDFDNSLSIAEVDQYLADNNITKIKQFGTFGHVFLAESATEITTNDKIVSVVRDHEQGVTLLATEIELVDRSVPSSFGTEELQNWWKVASINSIDFDNTTQTHMVRGINSTVYIVDSGIAIEHPEFVNSNITLLHSFNDNFIDNKGHGTALSSLIVGGTCSLSNPALKVVKVFDTTTIGWSSFMAALTPTTSGTPSSARTFTPVRPCGSRVSRLWTWPGSRSPRSPPSTSTPASRPPYRWVPSPSACPWRIPGASRSPAACPTRAGPVTTMPCMASWS